MNPELRKHINSSIKNHFYVTLTDSIDVAINADKTNEENVKYMLMVSELKRYMEKALLNSALQKMNNTQLHSDLNGINALFVPVSEIVSVVSQFVSRDGGYYKEQTMAYEITREFLKVYAEYISSGTTYFAALVSLVKDRYDMLKTKVSFETMTRHFYVAYHGDMLTQFFAVYHETESKALESRVDAILLNCMADLARFYNDSTISFVNGERLYNASTANLDDFLKEPSASTSFTTR